MRLRYLLLFAWLLSGFSTRAQVMLTKLGSAAVPSYGTELVVNGTTAYVCTASAGQQSLLVYDLSAPAAPRLLSTTTLPNANGLPALPPRHAVVSGEILCVTSYPTALTTPHSVVLWTIDVSNPASPSVRTTGGLAGNDEAFVAASGNYFYVVPDNTNQLYVYNRTPVTSGSSTYLSVERTISLPYSLSGIISLNLSGTTAYVQYANATFATLDVSNAAQPVSSPGTTPGTISAVSGTLAAGLAQPVYAGSVPGNTLRFYSLTTPLQPSLLRSQAGTYGTRVAVSGQSVFTSGQTSPFIAAVPSSSEPLRGYFFASAGAAPLEAVAASTQGANALVSANNLAYLLTDSELSVYAFPATVTATRGATALAATLSLYPNPAHAAATLAVAGLPTTAAQVQATLLNATGRAVGRPVLAAVGQGQARATVPTAELAAGLYVLRLSALDAQGQLLGELPTQRLSVE